MTDLRIISFQYIFELNIHNMSRRVIVVAPGKPIRIPRGHKRDARTVYHNEAEYQRWLRAYIAAQPRPSRKYINTIGKQL